MTAIVIDGGVGPPSALRLASRPRPVAREGEILIEVRAAGVNRPDLLQRAGLYPPPLDASDILGLEVAGVVVEPAGRWRAGDHVCALLGGGGYAEYATCDARHALPLPAHLSFEEGASLVETVFTVHANVFEHGQLKSGETLLVHGATSGIGVMAIQMAKAAGARVIATTRGTDKAAAAQAIGADLAIDTLRHDFAAAVIADGGADVVLEMVGGDYFAKDIAALKTGGRIVFIAATAGWTVDLPILELMRKQAIVTGSTLRARDANEKARLAAAVERHVWPWLGDRRLKPVIHRCYDLADVAEAHKLLESNTHLGKVMLCVGNNHAGGDVNSVPQVK